MSTNNNDFITRELEAALTQAKEDFIWEWYTFVKKMTKERLSRSNGRNKDQIYEEAKEAFWYELSGNTTGLLTWDFVSKNKDRPWGSYRLSGNAAVVTSWDIVAQNPDMDWFYGQISTLPWFTFDIVEKNRDTIVWSWYFLSKNPSVASWELIIDHARNNRDDVPWNRVSLLQNPNVVRDVSYIEAIRNGALGRFALPQMNPHSFTRNPAITPPSSYSWKMLTEDRNGIWNNVVSQNWDKSLINAINIRWEDAKPFFLDAQKCGVHHDVFLHLPSLFPSWDYVVEKHITKHFQRNYYVHLSRNESIVGGGEFVMDNPENRKYPWNYIVMTRAIKLPSKIELEVLEKVVLSWHAQNVICRQIERSLFDPSYMMCRQRVMREYVSFCAETKVI